MNLLALRLLAASFSAASLHLSIPLPAPAAWTGQPASEPWIRPQGEPETWEVEAGRRENLHAYGSSMVVVRDADADGVEDLLVGAPCLGTEEPGYADLLSGATGERILRFEGEAPGDEFGFAVAAGCDLNRDGTPELVITARAAAGEGARRGVVSVYDGRTFKKQRELAGEEDHGFFGESVCCPGDIDGDGRGDLLVGAPGAAEQRGHVLLFSGPAKRANETLRGRRRGDAFGSSISGLEDLNGDGHADFGVCAPFAGSRIAQAGCFVAYSGQSLRPLRTLYGPESMCWFGVSAVNPGDLDGDAVDDLLIGAPATSLGDQSAVGWVGSYSGATGDSLAVYPGSEPGEFFGRSLAAGFDWDGDGVGDWAVGAPYGRGRSDRKRAGFVAVRSGTGPELKRYRGTEARGLLGSSLGVAAAPDGQLTLLVLGAPGRAESAFRVETEEDEQPKPGSIQRVH